MEQRMIQKNLELIYDYMGWLEDINDYPYPYGNAKALDSNSAWECVQEMARKADIKDFYYFIDDVICNKYYIYEYPFWIMNPDNFFNCMAKWLEVKNENI